MTQSARIGAPFLQPAQAQKETTVNEGLALFDMATSAAVDAFLADTPPAAPAVGGCYIVGASPTGAWLGHALALAGYTAGGWRFIGPVEGLRAIDKTSGMMATFIGGAWELGVRLGGPLPAIADPSGGTTVDTEARAAIAAIMARLREHGLVEP